MKKILTIGIDIPLIICSNVVLWFFAGISMMTSSCEEKANWTYEPKKEKKLVVESLITNEFKTQSVRISWTFSQPNEEPVLASGALVQIRTTEHIFHFYEADSLPGHYFSEFPVAATVDRIYTLEIQMDWQQYTAETYMIPVLPATPPSFSQHENTSLYKINWNNSPFNPTEQAMFEADISWEHIPGFDHPDSVSRARLKYYTLNTIDVSYVIFPQEKEEVLFPAGSIAIVTKYSLTDEYGAFLRALLAETEWQGSLFEEARGTLPTNISNGGLGYFSACSVITDTLIVQ